MTNIAKTLKTFYQLSTTLAAILLFLIASITIISSLKIPNGLRIFVVKTGSMAPSIPTGSLIVIKPFSQYQQNDVITFRNRVEDQKDEQLITHRIVKAEETTTGIKFTTKGDFNEVSDATLIEPNMILGKTIFYLPYIGFIIAFTKTPAGLIALIVIPATIIIYSELINIKNEIVRLYKSKQVHADKVAEA